MHLFIIRHLESIKNLANAISSHGDGEPLTEQGRTQGHALVEAVCEFRDREQLRVRGIYSAASQRSNETAVMIANALGVKAHSFDSLRSTKSGILAGLSEREAAKISPKFIWQLNLYRSGLYNSYDLERAEGKEKIGDFEDRVQRCLADIIAQPDEDLKIIVAHRSPITAMLLYFARSYYGYPTDFYGNVPLELGFVSWLQREPAGKWRFRAVNCDPVQILCGGNLDPA